MKTINIFIGFTPTKRLGNQMQSFNKATTEIAQLLRPIVAGSTEPKMIDSLRKQDLFPGFRCITMTVFDGVALDGLVAQDSLSGTREMNDAE